MGIVKVVISGEYKPVANFLVLSSRFREEPQKGLVGRIAYEPDPEKVYGISPFNRERSYGIVVVEGANIPFVYRITATDGIELFGVKVSTSSDEYNRMMKWLGLPNVTRHPNEEGPEWFEPMDNYYLTTHPTNSRNLMAGDSPAFFSADFLSVYHFFQQPLVF